VSEEFRERVEKLAVGIGTKVVQLRKKEFMIDVDQSSIGKFISQLVNELGVHHLSTITGLDLGQNIGIIYHFSHDKYTVHVKTLVPKSNPTATSIVEIIPGAILYEMEIHDMLGVTFPGNPWINQKLLLPDSWPADLPPPLLKTSKPAEIRKRLQLEAVAK
jgi:NADH:ubiquinone oxidoreductase subunit C